MDFGERLRTAREEAGFKSAAQFARVLGIEEHAYRKYERGQAECTFETLSRICDLLGITPNYLFPHAGKNAAGSKSSKIPGRERSAA